MTAARGVALGALGVAAVVVAVVLLSGGSQHTYRLLFQNAGQLVKDDDVQVGGRRVGSVRKIELTSDNQAAITIAVDSDFAPLHDGTTAIIRATSLSGVANRYVALTPGPNSNPKLQDGATLGQDKTTAPVDLDQLFNTLDPKTRKGLQQVIQGTAAQYQGQGKNVQQAAKYFSPALSTSSRLVNELDRDSQVFQDFIVNSSKTVTAIASRRDDLANLVSNANTTAAAIGSENVALARALGLLPGTLRQANTTFVNLRSTLDDLDTLVAASKPATKRLAPFFAALRPLVQDARPTIADLRKLIRRKGPNNDLIELLRKAPTLERTAKPVFANSITALDKTQPVVKFIRPYPADFVGWLRDFGQGAANYDANGHYARIQPIFNTFSFADNPTGGTLTPIPNALRLAGLQTGAIKRCPGAASQAPADGSAPWRDFDNSLDCDPSLQLPGP
ncbi:MAG: phospholipid/cholesterol/gamma-HCH transport system substrate-binding protein [Solirubrobacteraceae bacterium]|nr:phospholipid/cholesterol/gamma-HCH transport system substrate-binding protein [Solirubrobacteraceae bacterium]